jgi:hypothetical protein
MNDARIFSPTANTRFSRRAGACPMPKIVRSIPPRDTREMEDFE